MKIKQWFAQFFKSENLEEKAKTGNFSKEEFDKIEAACQKDLKMSFPDALAAMQQESVSVTALADDQKALLASIFAPTAAQAVEAAANVTDPQAAQAAATVATQKQTIETQAAQIAKLSQEPEPGKPQKMQANMKVIPFTGGAHTEKYALGIEHDLFATSKPWNAVMVAGQPLETIAASRGFDRDWSAYEVEFKKEVSQYGKSIAARIEALHSTGKLASLSMEAIDFTGFDNTKWGEEHVQRRQDAIILLLRRLNSVGKIFTVRYGVQNKEVLTNSFLTNFSSGLLEGRNFKGKSAVQPMEAVVFDVMLKHKFSNLKKLEKEYIGYLNRESSDPMKWTWIEWLIKSILEVAMNEWNERRILGYQIDAVEGRYNHHLHASIGVIQTLWGWAEDLRLKPIDGYAYTKSTILTTVESLVEYVFSKLPSLNGMALHINEKHLPWYNAAYRKEYGLQQDFTGNGKPSIMNYPNVDIIGVPNMGNSTMMILTTPGNIELLEFRPGEMANVGMQRDLEELMIFSYWKEGVTAYMVGLKHATAAALEADDYQNQYIFFTDDTVELDADVTTVDATKGMRFQTVENSGATAITDFVGAKPGLVYRLTCGNVTNASTIAKAAKFSELTAAFEPTAVGDYLEVYLYKNPDNAADALNGKFIEVKRKVTA